ncbi:MAG: aldo/keto reductase [Zavarzinella sp.]|nr:aldo/keto reductase [Zavarzinella sp.]
MVRRKLGPSGPEAGPQALGGKVFGWTADERASFVVLDAFVAAGLNLIDTAAGYSRWAPGNRGGNAETVIGNWLRRNGIRR